MQNTSQKYKENVYAPDRKTRARVTFDISDVTANGDVSSITTTSDSPLSVKAQLINKVRNSSYKTATLEKDRFLLDGSFSFADDTLANNGELGWSSASLCSADGTFFDNLIGSDGNCEDTSKFLNGTSTTVLDSVNKTQGNNSIKITLTATNGYIARYGVLYAANKYYIVLADVKNGNLSTGIKISNNGGGNSSTVLDTTKFNTVWFRYSTATDFNDYIIVNALGASGQFGYVDAVRMYEVSLSEYNSLTAMTDTQVADKYPYQEYRPAITFNFTSNHSSAGLTITFDEVMGEYATDFDMTAYDASNAVIATTVVTGNTQVIATPLGQLLNYRKVSVIIRKWSKPNRRARVMEVDFGIVKQYTDDNLIGMNLIEQMDMISGELPSAEFKFAVDNSDRAFNILNPDGFYAYLQQKQQVIGEIGLDIGNGVIEFVQIGNYLLQDWQSTEGSLTASFVARTNLDSMASFDYENLSSSTKSLYQLAVDIFTLCGITNYSIDSALSSINTNTLVNKANCRDILQMIAIAGCANIFVTRGNIITLKCNPSLIGPPVDTADFDNMYNEPQITLDKAVKRVEVTYWTDLSTSAIIGVNSTTDTLGDTLKLENNTLINNSTRATAVANWFFAQLKYRATYRINWRGNPATELNDVFSFENSYGSNMSAYVTRNELDYTGSLKSRIEAKGVVN